MLQFSVAGVEAVDSALGQTQGNLKAVQAGAQSLATAASTAFTNLGQTIIGKLAPALAPFQQALAPLAARVTAMTAAAGAAFTSLKTTMAASITAIDGAIGKLQAGFVALRVGVNAFASLAQSALGGVIGKIEGLVRQGLAAGIMGQQLNYWFERLALSAAGLFRPEIQKVTELVQRLVNWLGQLTEKQREQIASWIKAGAAVLAVSIMLPKFVAGIELVIGAVRGLTAAIDVALSSTGIGALLPIVGALLASFVATGAGAAVLQGGLSELWEMFKPLVEVFQEAAKEVFPLLQPVFAAARAVVGALVPIMKIFMDVTKSLGTAMVPLYEALGKLIFVLLKIAEPLLKLWAILQKFVAWIVDKLARALNWVMDVMLGILQLLGLATGKEFEFKIKETKVKPSRDTEVPRSAGFSSIEDVYFRVAAKSVQLTSGKSDAQRQLEEQQRTTEEVRRTNQILDRTQPPIARR